MSSMYPAAMRRLINELTKLPSIGEKSAVRLAYHLLTRGKKDSQALADAIREASASVRLCCVCHFLSESLQCRICSDPERTRNLLCVVEKPADVIALERSGGYRGLYHVLHGVWSPLRGVGPEKTKVGHLLQRLKGIAPEFAVAGEEPAETNDPLELPLSELILATGTTIEGDATALYIANSLEGMSIPITRIAQGLPKGGELEYADELTLHLSLEGRRSL